MSAIHRIVVLVGSLRRESFSRKIAAALMESAPPSLKLEQLEIGHLPLYNQDFDDEGNPPESYVAFRAEVMAFDGVLLVTPEYNRSVPAVLKNALDVGSRPYGRSVWTGKPGAIVSCSPGAIGGFGANHHLRQSLVFLDMPAMQQPEMYIGGAAKLFDSAGKLTEPTTRELLVTFLKSFAEWVPMTLSRVEAARKSA